jgi:hypothetical protein
MTFSLCAERLQAEDVRTPIKLTTSGRSKLTTCFAGEDFQFMSCQAVHKN